MFISTKREILGTFAGMIEKNNHWITEVERMLSSLREIWRKGYLTRKVILFKYYLNVYLLQLFLMKVKLEH